MRRAAFALVACLTLGACSGTAESAADYPSRAIDYVVPFAAGGSTDIAARAAADALSGELDVPVNVINKPGADQIIGTDSVRTADPDGYTLLADGAGSSSIQGLLPYVPYPWDDRTFVARFAQGPHVYVVGGDSPYRDFDAVVAAAREDPERFTVGWIGGSSTSDFATLQFLASSGIDAGKVRRVPFRSSGEVMRAVAAGDIDFGAGGASSAFSLAGTGKLRAVAVTGDTPVDELPDTPTTTSLGHPELDMRYWVGVSAPPGLPGDITGKLADAVAAIAEQDDVVARLRAVGLEPAVLTGEDLRTAIGREKDRFTTLSDQVGVAG
ncbi:Bug family tripartite tricarboxylate transporter substrate binding protein [Actinophytocola gossypii]|uniref:Tripartite tricarboxylate transporter substrate binding protein n=1 Tax=Actinophytocola gossypii TaxID=2812003 RepID=A0ABT2J9D8_9PSEU|nr:tripartite tricarboxylate transporter substrate binding protein [Actinophytocola gossypii]MCT2584481.1 tripartite tricarboxylate transporter substrate binding protein [Actinophytocola gossypii]